MNVKSMTTATLSARELAARTALCRLRDCSREIERMAARVRAAQHGSAPDQIEQRVRAFTTEAARIRVELRLWDIGSPLWIERLQARVDRLAVEIGRTAEATLNPSLTAQARDPSDRAGVRARAIEHVERTVYDHLYPRPGTAVAPG